jgi:hypothetical protein
MGEGVAEAQSLRPPARNLLPQFSTVLFNSVSCTGCQDCRQRWTMRQFEARVKPAGHWVGSLFCIREVRVQISAHRQVTVNEVFRGFPQSLQINFGAVPLPSTPIRVHDSVLSPTLQLLTASLNKPQINKSHALQLSARISNGIFGTATGQLVGRDISLFPTSGLALGLTPSHLGPVSRLRMQGATYPLLHTSSWRAATLNTGTSLT